VADNPPILHRVLDVPLRGDGMRLDRFLAARFADRSRSELVKGIKKGQVCTPEGVVLRSSSTVRAGQLLHITIAGIAPSTPPPAMPQILFEDDHVAVLNKPPGLLAHPAGTAFAWSVIRAAKDHWPEHRVDLAHRLDRDTSGTMTLAKQADANRFLKAAFVQGRAIKIYEAVCRGVIPWDSRSLDGSIGPHGGEIRILMAVRADGLASRTDAVVLRRGENWTHVRLRLHTGRTHQIRVHMADAGFPLLGDRLYGLPFDVALRGMEEGWDEAAIVASGAKRQALHAASIRFPHPTGGEVVVTAPVPEDMRRLMV